MLFEIRIQKITIINGKIVQDTVNIQSPQKENACFPITVSAMNEEAQIFSLSITHLHKFTFFALRGCCNVLKHTVQF